MKEIQLTNGFIAIVDDEDYEYLNQWKWHANKSRHVYYCVRAIYDRSKKCKQNKLLMHRVIMNAPKGMEVDHKNHDGLDNRKENLRIVTNRENHLNRIDQAKFVGVSKSKDKFKATIGINGKNVYLGSFTDQTQAHAKYMEMFKLLNNNN